MTDPVTDGRLARMVTVDAAHALGPLADLFGDTPEFRDVAEAAQRAATVHAEALWPETRCRWCTAPATDAVMDVPVCDECFPADLLAGGEPL